MKITTLNYVEKSIAKDIAILMDMSIYQIEFMDKVPTYAVVNEAVEIASQLHKGKYKSMSNIRFSSGICIRQSLEATVTIKHQEGNEHLKGFCKIQRPLIITNK